MIGASTAIDTERTITFPLGLPGFERSQRFVLVTAASFHPFTLVKGDGDDAPSFVAIDPRLIDPAYAPEIGEAERERLGAGPGETLLWLALVASPPDGRATVNLRAPIVINPATMRGLQLVPADSPYRLDHPLPGL